MSNLLYNKNTVIGRLFCYFSMYFTGVPVPTMESLCLLLISMLALESAGSVRSLYRHFLSKITEKSLNAFYYACSYAKADYTSMKLIPYTDAEWKEYRTHSVQEFRFMLSEQIREQVIFAGFAALLENGIKTKEVINLLKQKVWM